MTTMEENSSFWESVQFLQEQNVFCDIQLTVNSVDDSSMVVDTINVHKVILVSCSKYFQELLSSGDLYDVYSFVGVSKEHLQLVVDYMYRKLSREELIKVPEAANTASTIKVLSHDYASNPTGVFGEILNRLDEETSLENQSISNEMNNADNQGMISPKQTTVSDKNQGNAIEKAQCLPPGLKGNNKRGSPTRTKKKVSVSRKEKRKYQSSKEEYSPDWKITCVKSEKEINEKLESSDMSALSSRSSRRKRKTLNYKLMSEGKDISDDSSEETDQPSAYNEKSGRHNGEGHPEYIPEIDPPPKRKRGRPPKPFPYGAVQSEKQESVVMSQKTTEEARTSAELLVEPTDCTSENKSDDVQSTADQGIGETLQNAEQGPIGIMPESDRVIPGDQMEVNNVTHPPEGITDTPVTPILPNSETPECSPEEKKESKSTPDPERGEGENKKLDGNLLPCDKCRRCFKSEHALKQHRKIIHKVKGPVNCVICDENFDSEPQLKEHMKEKHDLSHYRCQECDLDFRSREGFKLHWSKKHSGREPRKVCEQCGKKFFNQGELRSHIQYKHSAARNFPCNQCARAFKSNAMLQRHVNTYHSTVRNFKCDVCDLMFKTKNDCKAHRQKHFRVTNPLSKERAPKPKSEENQQYPCNYCDKVFKKRTRQLVHENLQHRQKNDGTSFLCTLCSKEFAIKHYLMQHIKHCHSERRYSCPGCLQTFAQRVDVKKHYTTPGRCKGVPRDPKPFSCPQCGKGFSLKGNLGKHLQRPGRCRGPNTRNPDVIVVVKQTENRAGGEGAETDQAGGNIDAGADAQQLGQEEETNEEYGVLVAQALAAGSKELGEPRIVELSPGGENVAFQGIVNGQLVPVTMTSEGGQVQYQVVTEVYEYGQVVDDDQQPVVTYSTTDQLEGQHVHLVEETPIEVTAQGKQVYSLIEKLKPSEELTQTTESQDKGDVSGEQLVDSQLVIEGHVVLEGDGTDPTQAAQVIEGQEFTSRGDHQHIFASGEGNRLLIQGQSIIPIGEAAAKPESIHIVQQAIETTAQEVVGIVEMVEEQQILQVETDLTLTECDPETG